MRFWIEARFKPEHFMDSRRSREIEATDHADAQRQAEALAREMSEEHERDCVGRSEMLPVAGFEETEEEPYDGPSEAEIDPWWT